MKFVQVLMEELESPNDNRALSLDQHYRVKLNLPKKVLRVTHTLFHLPIIQFVVILMGKEI